MRAFLLALIISIASFCYGYNLANVNAPKSIFTQCSTSGSQFCFNVSEDQWALLISIFSAGGFLGTLMAPNLTLKYGKRRVLLCNNLFLVSGYLLMALAKGPNELIVGRFLLGIGSGISNGICSPYLLEIAETNVRGAFGALQPIILVFGILIAQVFGIFLIDDDRWRLMFGFPAILCLIQIVGLLKYSVDSPPDLFMKGDFEGVKKSLIWLQRKNPDFDFNLMRTQDFSFTSLRQLFFTSEFRRAWRSLVVAIGLHLLLQFSGISGIFYYSNYIFEKNLGMEANAVSGFSAGLGAINWLATLSSIILVERYGRRTLLITSMIIQAVMGLLITIFIPTKIYLAFLISIYLYVAAFATGLGCLPWIIMAELFPPRSVSSAASVAVSFNWISSFIVSYATPYMIDSMKEYWFIIFEVFVFLGCFFAYFSVPETKGRVLSYIPPPQVRSERD